jgi:hypothetical protein
MQYPHGQQQHARIAGGRGFAAQALHVGNRPAYRIKINCPARTRAGIWRRQKLPHGTVPAAHSPGRFDVERCAPTINELPKRCWIHPKLAADSDNARYCAYSHQFVGALERNVKGGCNVPHTQKSQEHFITPTQSRAHQEQKTEQIPNSPQLKEFVEGWRVEASREVK